MLLGRTGRISVEPLNKSIMSEENRQTVVMTAEEKAEFEAFQRAKAKKAAEEKAKADREMYRQMVDDEIEHSIPVLLCISEEIKESKQKVLDNFKTILEMKSDLFKNLDSVYVNKCGSALKVNFDIIKNTYLLLFYNSINIGQTHKPQALKLICIFSALISFINRC